MLGILANSANALSLLGSNSYGVYIDKTSTLTDVRTVLVNFVGTVELKKAK